MLDSPGLRIAVRRDPPTVEDLRSTTVPDDPVQRRDLILLERARDGDLDAFNDLVMLYQDQLFALVVRMVPDRDQASDCVQEAFFSAFRNLTSFRGGSVKSWLNRICVNAAMDTQRARKRRPVQPYPELDDESWQPPAGTEADPERTAMLAERTRALSGALAGITDDQRAAIVLYDVEGYDYAEIAEMTGVSLGTVKSRIHRGRLALRDLLGRPDGAVPWLIARPRPRTSTTRYVIAALLDGDRRPRTRRWRDCSVADLSGLRRAPRRSAGAVGRDPRPPDAGSTARLPADRGGRRPARHADRGTGRVDAPSGGRDDRSNDPAGHAGHDTLLVASLADHSLAPTERAAAEALVAACAAAPRSTPTSWRSAMRPGRCRPRPDRATTR